MGCILIEVAETTRGVDDSFKKKKGSECVWEAGGGGGVYDGRRGGEEEKGFGDVFNMHIREAAAVEAKWNTTAFSDSPPTRRLTFPAPDVIFIAQTQPAPVVQLTKNKTKKTSKGCSSLSSSRLEFKNAKKKNEWQNSEVFFPLVASDVELAAANKSPLCDV